MTQGNSGRGRCIAKCRECACGAVQKRWYDYGKRRWKWRSTWHEMLCIMARVGIEDGLAEYQEGSNGEEKGNQEAEGLAEIR